MRIYVDALRLVSREGLKFWGGANYGYRVIENILRYGGDTEVSIIWPSGYAAVTEAEKRLESNGNVRKIYTDSIEEVDFSECDTLFLPLVSVATAGYMKKLAAIKKKGSGLRIVGTIHDLRVFDLLEFDAECRFYFKSGIAGYIVQYLRYIRRCILSLPFLKVVRKILDVALFDSNFAMQSVQKYISLNRCELHYIGACQTEVSSDRREEDFILFVSGNRIEKNFSRALEAYLNAVKSGKIHFKLYVTGDRDQIREIARRKKIDGKLFEENVALLGYVSEKEMQQLYADCKFLLYVSKSEGFGLPALNAGIYGRPVVASSRTSVPEVLEACALYVDPYQVKSIETGICEMTGSLEKYEDMVRDYIPVIEGRIKAGERKTLEVLTQNKIRWRNICE